MFPLGGKAAVFGHDGPAIGQFLDVAATQVEHGLDGKDHAGLQLCARTGLAVVQHLGVFVKVLPYTVATEFAHDRQIVLFGKLLNRVADVAEVRAGLDLLNAQPHGVIGQGVEAARSNRHFANLEHAAVVAIPAVLDDGDIHIDNIAFLQRFVVGNAMAHHMVHRSAHMAGVGRVAVGLIALAGRDSALALHGCSANLIDLQRGNAGADMGGEFVQHFGCQAAGGAHGGNAGFVFDDDAHGVELSQLMACSAAWVKVDGAVADPRAPPRRGVLSG